MTWEEAYEKFETYLEARFYAVRSREGYLHNLRVFSAFARQHGIVNPTFVTRELVERYQNALCTQLHRGKPLAAYTRMARLVPLKLFFHYLTEMGMMIVDPTSRVQLPRVRRALPRVILSLNEVERLLSQPDDSTPVGLRDRAILELLYSTGIRNSELRFTRLSDLDLDAQELRVLGKGGKSRIVPIGQVAASVISRYLLESRPILDKEASEFLFVGVRSKCLEQSCLSRMVTNRAKQARLKAWKAVSCHVLRHTCATHLLRASAPLRAIQELLGHKSLSSTQIYTRVDISDLKRVHARCHPREKGASWIFPKASKPTSST